MVVAACLGGCAGAGLLWLLAGRERGDPEQTAVHGVLVSAVLTGATAVVLLIAPGELGSVVQWLVGSTEDASGGTGNSCGRGPCAGGRRLAAGRAADAAAVRR